MSKKSKKSNQPAVSEEEAIARMSAATGAPQAPGAAASGTSNPVGNATAAVDPVDLAFALGDNPNYLERLYAQLYNSEAARKSMMDRATALKMDPSAMAGVQQEFYKNPLNMQRVDITDGTKGSAFGNTMRLLGANIKAHPWQAAGTGLGLGINAAGLFDNDKMLGQAIGTVGGALLSKPLGLGAYGALNSALIGGGLGSLFDTLRAAKEKNERERLARLPASETTY
jgi:hypothetical protein